MKQRELKLIIKLPMLRCKVKKKCCQGRRCLKHIEHLNELYNLVLNSILEKHPSFFEQLIVDLMLKMGYGYDAESGITVGGSHDGGIDGIINEDKLGLDLIYLQAKRYKES